MNAKEAHQLAQEDQTDMFGKEKPMPRAEETSIGISYRTLLADFGEKLGKKTRMDMNLGQLARLGFIERKSDLIMEGPARPLDGYRCIEDRIINGALSDIFPCSMPRTPATIEASANAGEEQDNTPAEVVDNTVATAEEAKSESVETSVSENPRSESVENKRRNRCAEQPSARLSASFNHIEPRHRTRILKKNKNHVSYQITRISSLGLLATYQEYSA